MNAPKAGRLLIVDTATRHPTLALAELDGGLLGQRQWESRHSHGERLLEELDALLDEHSESATGLGAIVVGTGPGSFTGLRIGLATAKVLAYSLGIPVVGIPTARALALAAGLADAVVTLPAGASDRYVASYAVVDGAARELADPTLAAGPVAAGDERNLVAVDFGPAAGVPAEAIERGRRAMAGLAEALASEGARRLATGATDDVAALVPAYVALPRGITRAAEDIRWSPDLR